MAKHLGEPLCEANIVDFANGEIHCRFGESIRGGDVFIVQSHVVGNGRSLNDAIIENLIMVDAAVRASAKRVTAVCPFFGYARQDRKATGREPISAKLMADLFTSAGASRLVSVDLHSGQIQGYFAGPWDHLTAMPVLAGYLKNIMGNKDLAIVSPDAGRVRVAERYALSLDADIAFIYKRRSKKEQNVVEAFGVIGDVEGRVCALVDDMIDTAGTIVAAAEILYENGADEVYALATHGLFSGPAIERLNNSAISRVVVTDTLPFPENQGFEKLEVLSVAPIIADAIAAVFEDTSVSEIFDSQNQT